MGFIRRWIDAKDASTATYWENVAANEAKWHDERALADAPRVRLNAMIDAQLERDDLTASEISELVVARRLNNCSDNTLAAALGRNVKER